VMSLDNMLAVGGAAHGNIALLLFGLALSMPIIIFASGLIVALLHRLPWLLYVGAAILVYTAARLLLEDPLLRPHYPHTAIFTWAATLLMLVGVVGLAYWRNRRQSAAAPDAEREVAAPTPTAPADQPDPAPMEPKTLDSGRHSEQDVPRPDEGYARRAR
ncbi:MAG: TerC family protein, partial [Chloroflexota bacterium]